MGATDTPTTSSRTRYGLIALVAIRQARAMRERRAKEDAEREANKDATAGKRPKTRGWFR
ncbi:hypothetical protein [Brevundimonas sp. TWP2-3-4b1]|uniref:hypothetical protein n=1 Tax=Brevundimonas sp. TWP2-3-4b1 TaxID=2804580 RepID=UPI003CF736C2